MNLDDDDWHTFAVVPVRGLRAGRTGRGLFRDGKTGRPQGHDEGGGRLVADLNTIFLASRFHPGCGVHLQKA